MPLRRFVLAYVALEDWFINLSCYVGIELSLFLMIAYLYVQYLLFTVYYYLRVMWCRNVLGMDRAKFKRSKTSG